MKAKDKKNEIKNAIKREVHELITLYSGIHMCEISVDIKIDVNFDEETN